MSAAALDYRAGDLVRIHPREAPFWDDIKAWWTVVSVSDLGLNVECGGKVRVGVAPWMVIDGPKRKPT